MSPPVERSITVSAPYLSATRSLRSSPSASLVTALLPMFALTLQAERDADAHRLEVRVVHVRGDDEPPSRNFVAHDGRLDAFARRDVRHLLGDDPLAGVVHLGPALIA